jgi:hypothetical protein
VLKYDGDDIVGIERVDGGEYVVYTVGELGSGTVAVHDLPALTLEAITAKMAEAGVKMDETTFYVDLQDAKIDVENRGDNKDDKDPAPEGFGGETQPDEEPENNDDPKEGEEMEDQGNPPQEPFDIGERPNQGNEDAPTGNSMADDLWALLKPNVVEVVANGCEYTAEFVAEGMGRILEGMRREGFGPETPGGREHVPAPKFDGKPIPKPEVGELRHFQYPKLRNALARRVFMYLPGTPGVGKSEMVKHVADDLGLPFSARSFSPMSTESSLIGFRDAHGNYVRTDFRDRYEFGGIMLLDELDNSNPAVVAALNSGLAQQFMAFPDGVVERHPDFICVATANTFGTGPTAEFAGRQKLDPATLNRFVKMEIVTDESLETAIVEGILGTDLADSWLKKVRHVRNAVADMRIKTFVTMRDAILGAKLIQPGAGKFSQKEALDMTIMCVLSEDAQKKVASWKAPV